MMATTKSTKTIADVLAEFLIDQKGEIGGKTYRKHQEIISLFTSYLDNYCPGHDGEYAHFTKDGGTFCGTFGPEEITAGYSEFLGYFMPRKVMCGKDTMQAAGTVTKKLAKWLAQKGYIADTEETKGAQKRAGKAAKDLPNSLDVLEMLTAWVDETAPDVDEDSDTIEDHFWISRMEPGQLWLEPVTEPHGIVGPVPVPEEVTQLCQPHWDIAGVLAKVGDGWRFAEVWSVTP
jgi:hypothetical protein